jgi:hypothetical protein
LLKERDGSTTATNGHTGHTARAAAGSGGSAAPPLAVAPPTALPRVATKEPWFQLATTALSCLSVIFAAAAYLIASG